MGASFVTYIDESGDEGFKFRRRTEEQASSDWFVLAAFITVKRSDLQVVRVIDTVRREFRLRAQDHVHWKKLKHLEKLRFAQVVVPLQTKVTAVCVHKPSLLAPQKFQDGYRLYFYAVRCLLERVSWLTRDMHDPARRDGDGTTELVFSNRQGMPYEQMRDYLRLLAQQQRAGHDIRIEFDRIPVARFRTQAPGTSMGLQLADAAAGAFFNALERDRFGNTEPRYLQTLSPLLYRHEDNVHGYGLKIMPTQALPGLKQETSLGWLPQFR